MPTQKNEIASVPVGLLEAIRSLPATREVEHCGVRFDASPLGRYATCPHCGSLVKLRSYSSADEVEDVFDAVLEWMLDPTARQAAERRMAEIRRDQDE